MAAGLLFGCLLPHPPVLLPEVGGDMADEVKQTVEAIREVAQHIASCEPDTLVLMGPHGPLLRDCMAVGTAAEARGDFRNFNAPQVQLQVECDTELVRQLQLACERVVIPLHSVDTLTNSSSDGSFYWLDHGAAVPLHFLLPIVGKVRVVLLGFSYLPRGTHLSFGERIREACDTSGKRVVFVASGDLSHRLLPTGPYGFDPRGPAFDDTIVSSLRSQDWDGIVNISDDLVEGAGVCGYLSLLTLMGALRQRVDQTTVLSYQGPFGVGYAVAEMTTRGRRSGVRGPESGIPTPESEFRDPAAGSGPGTLDPGFGINSAEGILPGVEPSVPTGSGEGQSSAPTASVSASAGIGYAGVRAALDFTFPDGDVSAQILALARASFETYARYSRRLLLPVELPQPLLEQRACFVTLRSGGRLRGCVGTIVPARATLAHEIVENAIGSASRDHRFKPVSADELDDIACSVDVLMPPEPVIDRDMLDPARYGMVVVQGERVGVLLPGLPEVTTAEQQYEICLEKAGISTPTDIAIYRFEVVRHAEPGAEH